MSERNLLPWSENTLGNHNLLYSIRRHWRAGNYQLAAEMWLGVHNHINAIGGCENSGIGHEAVVEGVARLNSSQSDELLHMITPGIDSLQRSFHLLKNDIFPGGIGDVAALTDAYLQPEVFEGLTRKSSTENTTEEPARSAIIRIGQVWVAANVLYRLGRQLGDSGTLQASHILYAAIPAAYEQLAEIPEFRSAWAEPDAKSVTQASQYQRVRAAWQYTRFAVGVNFVGEGENYKEIHTAFAQALSEPIDSLALRRIIGNMHAAESIIDLSLVGVVAGIRYLQEMAGLQIYSDSQELVRGVTQQSQAIRFDEIARKQGHLDDSQSVGVRERLLLMKNEI